MLKYHSILNKRQKPPLLGKAAIVALTLASLFAVVTFLVPSMVAAQVAPWEEVWEIELPPYNLTSSPVIADIDSDGRNEIVFGHRDGHLRAFEADGSLKWATPAVPGPSRSGCLSQSTPSAIDSSPAVADIDNDGTFEVVVGVGSADPAERDQNGSVIVFDGRTGEIEWSFAHSRDNASLWGSRGNNSQAIGDRATADEDGWCEGTYSTPAIGDINGDGIDEIIFGSYDFFVWAVDGKGNPLPGFPIDNDDTIWASPALFDVDNDGDVEIFLGGDSTLGGYVDQLGGVFRAFDYRNGRPEIFWQRFANDTFHSSAAIGDINGDGRFEVLTGTGENWQIQCMERGHRQCRPGDGTDNTRIWAFHLDDGSNVPGWPVRADDTVWSTPSLGDLDGDGLPEVVVGSDDTKIRAIKGDGSVLWSVQPQLAHLGGGGFVRGSAVIVDLDGDADQDVAIWTARGLALLDGSNGAEMERDLHWTLRTGFTDSFEMAPAVGTFNGERRLIYVANTSGKVKTVLAAHRLPPTSSRDAWPMWRHNAFRTGTASTSAAGHRIRGADELGRYYARPLQWLVGRDYIDPGSGACMSPQTPATRGETALYLWRVKGRPQAVPHRFSDVAGTELNQAVAWMSETGITTGKSQERFAPNDRLTRAEVAAFLHRDSGSTEMYQHPFTDLTASWQEEGVAWMHALKITTGTSETTFSPNISVTRGELATFLYRYAGSPDVEFDPNSGDCSPKRSARSGFARYIEVATGGFQGGIKHTCALRDDGKIRCWGDNGQGQLNVPAESFKSVSAGATHTCGVTVDNRIRCWGDNRRGQSNVPAESFKSVSAGVTHTCGVTVDNRIICWGDPQQERLNVPAGEFVSVSANILHSCGVRVDNSVKCWGADQNNSTDPPEGQFSSVAAGVHHTCGLRSQGSVSCWGRGTDGPLAAPQGQFKSVSAGNRFSCAVRANGSILCWGETNGVAGLLEPPAGSFESVDVNNVHACAIPSGGANFKCWGIDVSS
ncbi:MAG: FG-GAP-like repeat-containing protein [Acidimicrobiaceae bacterium]|nr:VCBS repeat-containing protein [Acidimicrobiia bacterium]MCY4493128.1 FG-GAP-like repeat-containing protein [Acidimicrobiaceae bacterium]